MAGALDAQALLAALPEAVVIADAAGSIRQVNPAAAALFGYDAGELVGQPLTALIPPEARRRVNVLDWLRRTAGSPALPVWHYVHLTGRTRGGDDVRLAVRVGRLDDGFVLSLRDVGRELAAAIELKHQHLVVSRALALSEDAVLMLDGRRRVTWVNPALCRLFGYTAAGLAGQPLSLLLPERLRAQHDVHVDAFERGQSPARMMGERREVTGRRADGVEIPLDVSITKLLVDGQRVFAAVVRDARARRAAEDAVRDAQRRFALLFEHAMQAMALLRPDGTVEELNPAARSLLQPAPAATAPASAAGPGARARADAGGTGRAFWDLDWWPGLQGPALEAARQRLRAAVGEAAAGGRVHARARRADGGEIDFSMVPVPSAAGGIAHLIAEGRVLAPVRP